MKIAYHVVLVGLALAGLAAFLAQRSKVTDLGQENERLKAELAAQRSDNTTSNGQDERQNEELDRLRADAREVHRLRNEVSQLRAGAQQLDQLRTENQQLRTVNRQFQAAPKTSPAAAPAVAAQEGYYPKENWTFAGYATPEAALQSVVWAMREGDTRTFLASMTSDEMARMQQEWGDKSEAEISADARKGAAKLSAVRILERKALSDDEIVLSVYAEGGDDKVQKISMKRFGAEWKLAGPKRD